MLEFQIQLLLRVIKHVLSSLSDFFLVQLFSEGVEDIASNTSIKTIVLQLCPCMHLCPSLDYAKKLPKRIRGIAIYSGLLFPITPFQPSVISK